MEMLIIALLASVMLVVYDDEMQNEMITQFVGERDAGNGHKNLDPDSLEQQAFREAVDDGFVECPNPDCCGSGDDLELEDYEVLRSNYASAFDHSWVILDFEFYVACVPCWVKGQDTWIVEYQFEI
jgi:hypothetical protein